MHTIRVPESVTVTDPLTDEPLKGLEPVSFKVFVLGTLLMDDRWRKDLESIESALKIRQAVRAFGEDGGLMPLEDDDHKRLKECAERPTNGYGNWTPIVLPQFMPFFDAIRGAQKGDIAPAKKKDA